jgi:aminoglycoside 6'-N-acetyltransferase
MTSVTPERFGFRELTRGDLPLLLRWRASEHGRMWWGEPDNVEADHFALDQPVDRFIALLDGAPVGLVQCYRWGDFPDEAQAVGARQGELGIDYLLGEADLIGRGLGPAMLNAFLSEVVPRGRASGVRVDVAEANRRSWRCLEKLGFERVANGVTVAGEPGPHYIYVLPPRARP